MLPSNSFFAAELDIANAARKAKANKGFWCMVWSGNGVTYTELRQMDLAEYQECRQAKRLWVEQWREEAKPK